MSDVLTYQVKGVHTPKTKAGFAKMLALLEAAEDRGSAEWLLLRGRAHMEMKEYPGAVACLEKTEDPGRLALLEVCYREMGDFQKAYFYACRQREKE